LTTRLHKPIVAVPKEKTSPVTLQAGASVEYHVPARIGLVDIECDGEHYSVFLDDLLDACSPGEVGLLFG
jgi:hypothetical protein